MTELLQVVHVSKSYPGLPVLQEASFTAASGEIVCLLGPSGCGKTTLLRIVAGLETPDTGRVLYDGQDLAGMPVHRRNFGLMFQDYALFPHKNVAANVAFGLRMQGRGRGEISSRVAEMLALVELSGYEKRRVIELSGGEQQRVALARSLAPRPRLLMLDEPLGALDRTLREQLMHDVRAIIKRVGVTAIYVTHDQEEAFAVADRVLIMRARPEAGVGGWIEQAGTPQMVYRHPVSPYVARFLGLRNLLAGTVAAGAEPGNGGHDGWPSRSADAGIVFVDTTLGRVAAGDVQQPRAPGEQVVVLIRPEAARLRPAGEGGANTFPGRLVEASFRGSYCLVRTEHADGVVLTSEAAAADVPPVGAPLALRLDPGAITLLLPEE